MSWEQGWVVEGPVEGLGFLQSPPFPLLLLHVHGETGALELWVGTCWVILGCPLTSLGGISSSANHPAFSYSQLVVSWEQEVYEACGLL